MLYILVGTNLLASQLSQIYISITYVVSSPGKDIKGIMGQTGLLRQKTSQRTKPHGNNVLPIVLFTENLPFCASMNIQISFNNISKHKLKQLYGQWDQQSLVSFPSPKGHITAFAVINRRLIGDRAQNQCMGCYIVFRLKYLFSNSISLNKLDF